jgi:C1A family cysteine protease
MNLKTTLILLLTINTVFAKTISPSTKAGENLSESTQIVLSELWKKSGHAESLLVPTKEIEQKVPINKSKTPIIEKEVLSEGQKYIRDALAKNREKVKNFQESKIESEKNETDWRKKNLNFLRNSKTKTQRSLRNWDSKVKQQLKSWAEKRREFKKNIPEYKKHSFEFESDKSEEIDLETTQKILARNLKNLQNQKAKTQPHKVKSVETNAVLRDYHLIPDSLDLTVRDQGRRPTCAAFAAIRAIEVLANAQNERLDLSEQYFYWMSKPECQSSPCSTKGSWLRKAFVTSQEQSNLSIPSELNCPYNKTSNLGNETQIPIQSSCNSGEVKVSSFYTFSKISDIKNSINKNHPVVTGLTLDDAFYTTTGFVKLDSKSSVSTRDSHAKGHALLIVGIMDLPKNLHSSQGKICYIVTNSWGEGWGVGGHGCITQNWLKKHKIKNDFVALTKIKIKDY